MKRAKALITAAGHSVRSKGAPEAVRMELENLLKDMDVYASRQEELLQSIEEKLKEVPYIDKAGDQRDRNCHGQRLYSGSG